MHLDEEQVQRLLHGEPAPASAVRDHLATCADCRFRMTQAEREEAEVLDLLRRLDHPPPKVDVEALTAGVPRRAAGWIRWAAGVFLALGAAGAAYAAPGSPLPGLVARVIRWARPAPQPVVPTAPSQGTDDSAGGIAVAPGARFTILFPSEPGGAQAAVSLTDGTDIEVHTVHGTATFMSDVDRLSIDPTTVSTRFEILIPRRAPSVEIRVGGRRVLLKEGSHLRTEGRQDGEGRYLLPLAPQKQ